MCTGPTPRSNQSADGSRAGWLSAEAEEQPSDQNLKPFYEGKFLDLLLTDRPSHGRPQRNSLFSWRSLHPLRDYSEKTKYREHSQRADPSA